MPHVVIVDTAIALRPTLPTPVVIPEHPTPVRRQAIRPVKTITAVHHAHLAHRPLPLHRRLALSPVMRLLEFRVAPTTIPQGSGATLCVRTVGAVALSVTPFGALTPNRLICRHVMPQNSTTYRLWAIGGQGDTIEQSVRLIVTSAL